MRYRRQYSVVCSCAQRSPSPCCYRYRFFYKNIFQARQQQWRILPDRLIGRYEIAEEKSRFFESSRRHLYFSGVISLFRKSGREGLLMAYSLSFIVKTVPGRFQSASDGFTFRQAISFSGCAQGYPPRYLDLILISRQRRSAAFLLEPGRTVSSNRGRFGLFS